jgi:hypothetical protein
VRCSLQARYQCVENIVYYRPLAEVLEQSLADERGKSKTNECAEFEMVSPVTSHTIQCHGNAPSRRDRAAAAVSSSASRIRRSDIGLSGQCAATQCVLVIPIKAMGGAHNDRTGMEKQLPTFLHLGLWRSHGAAAALGGSEGHANEFTWNVLCSEQGA